MTFSRPALNLEPSAINLDSPHTPWGIPQGSITLPQCGRQTRGIVPRGFSMLGDFERRTKPRTSRAQQLCALR